MRTSAKRVARTIYEMSRAHKYRLLSAPGLAIDATPEKYQIGSTFYFTEAGTVYSKAAAAAIAFSAAHPVEEGKFGAILIEIATYGTPASKIGEATQTTIQSYATAALARAALPAVTAGKRILGNIVINAKHKYAVLSTALAGNNNDLDFTSVLSGVAGNSTTIQYVNPGADHVLSIAVVGQVITITLGYATGAISSTAANIKTIIDATPAAAALVTVANKAANDGTGLVIALAATPLATGTATGWTATTDDMTDASDVTTAVFTDASTAAEPTNIGSSWMEKTAAYQQARVDEVLSFIHTGTVPSLDAALDKMVFRSVVDSLRSRALIV